jgi:hypothetical protein
MCRVVEEWGCSGEEFRSSGPQIRLLALARGARDAQDIGSVLAFGNGPRCRNADFAERSFPPGAR